MERTWTKNPVGALKASVTVAAAINVGIML